jgi:hypothetical protein
MKIIRPEHIPAALSPADAATKAIGWTLHHRNVCWAMGHCGCPDLWIFKSLHLRFNGSFSSSSFCIGLWAMQSFHHNLPSSFVARAPIVSPTASSKSTCPSCFTTLLDPMPGVEEGVVADCSD